MANTYHQIYVQAVFAVKYRKAVIKKEWKEEFQGVIGNLINERNCKTLIVNGVEDHMHCLIALRPVVSVSDLMQHVKAKSSKYLNDRQVTRSRFEWQDGYGVFSYSHNDLDRIYKYIANQEEHHRKELFHDEYLALLKEFNIQYDERYLFQPLI